MDFPTLHSITEPARFYETGKKPILLTTNTTEDYICKHNFGHVNTLFNEYLAVAFLKLWSIPVPNACFINVNPEHIYNFAIENGLQPAWFRRTCFGSYYLKFAKELDENFGLLISKAKLKFDIFEFFNIVLFDIWVANEDRNVPNPNLLVEADGVNWKFFPIDHELIFNSSSGQPLEQINENDTILAHDLFKSLLRWRKVRHREIIAKLLNGYEAKIARCKEKIEVILEIVPDDWQIDIRQKREFLENNIFADTWITETKSNFKSLYNKLIK